MRGMRWVGLLVAPALVLLGPLTVLVLLVSARAASADPLPDPSPTASVEASPVPSEPSVTPSPTSSASTPPVGADLGLTPERWDLLFGGLQLLVFLVAAHVVSSWAPHRD